MYAITGATGNTGSVVAEKLLSAGQHVRVLGRNAQRLDRFTSKGAEAFLAEATDAEAMGLAFAGVKAVYALIPPNPTADDVLAYEDRVSDAMAEAIAASGVANVVMLSSVGAEKPSGTGPIVPLHNFEEKLKAIPNLNALFLRADYFMENLLPQAAVIHSMGMIGGPVRADLPIGMIAASDIGAIAADALLRLDFRGKSSMGLQGPRDVDYNQVAKIIGAAIGKPGLTYQQVPGMFLKPAMMKMGMSASMVDLLLELGDALNSGHVKALEPRTAKNTGVITVEAFVSEFFLPAYNAKAARA